MFRARTPVAIYDKTRAVSRIDVTEARALTSLEVFVNVRHTWVGDLVITLEHDGWQRVLMKHELGGQRDLVRTFQIPEVQGLQLRGRWDLVITDDAGGDQGTLDGWQLIAH